MYFNLNTQKVNKQKRAALYFTMSDIVHWGFVLAEREIYREKWVMKYQGCSDTRVVSASSEATFLQKDC